MSYWGMILTSYRGLWVGWEVIQRNDRKKILTHTHTFEIEYMLSEPEARMGGAGDTEYHPCWMCRMPVAWVLSDLVFQAAGHCRVGST